MPLLACPAVFSSLHLAAEFAVTEITNRRLTSYRIRMFKEPLLDKPAVAHFR
jgi:hypothetical protein